MKQLEAQLLVAADDKAVAAADRAALVGRGEEMAGRLEAAAREKQSLMEAGPLRSKSVSGPNLKVPSPLLLTPRYV